MKLHRSHLEIAAIIAVYFMALFLWGMQFHNNGMPFGDVDASSHFIIGDYMATNDKSVSKLPYYVQNRYAGQNDYHPDSIWYPPQYWTLTAISQVFGGERVLPVMLFIVISCSLIVLSSYFFIRSLFGFWPAILSSLLLSFSTRDFMVYLWGQWPQAISFALTPLALFCGYQYYQQNKEHNSQIYLYILAILLSAQFFFHPQGLIASAVTLIFFFIIISIKEKKLSFSITHAFLATALFVTLCAIAAPLNIQEFLGELGPSDDPDSNKPAQLNHLFKWYHGIKNDPGLPDFYFTYNGSHGSLSGGLLSWWTLALLLIGLIALAMRRNIADLMLLCWFLAFYVLTRLSVIGMGGRDIRMFGFEAHVIYPIIVLGLLSIASFLKAEQLRHNAKLFLIALFVIFAIFVNGKSAYMVLSTQENSITRINQWQYDGAEWLRSNTPVESHVYDVGTFGYNYFGGKIKWLSALSQRRFALDDSEIAQAHYIMLDYSDGQAMQNQQYIMMLQSAEQQLANATKVYDNQLIKVFKIA